MVTQWTVDKVKSNRAKPKQQKKHDKDEKKKKSKGLAVIPYIEGLSERLSRTLKKHGFSTAMKPHKTLRNMLVHPKDKRNPMQTAEAIYEIPCKNCPKTYIGETGHLFKTRLSEHRTETEKVSGQILHQGTKKIFHKRNPQVSHHWACRKFQPRNRVGWG